jgi:hypothetical protein
MSNHPNFDRTQTVLDAVRQGDYAPAFDLNTDDIQMDNGPGAGPWHFARGKDDMTLMLTEFAGFFGDTPSTKTAAASAPTTIQLSASSTRPGQRLVATSSTTSRYTPCAFTPTGTRTGSGPLTSTPSTVKRSGRKTLAHPRKTSPRSRGVPWPSFRS